MHHTLLTVVDSTPKCNTVGEKDGELAYIVFASTNHPPTQGVHYGNVVQPTHQSRT